MTSKEKKAREGWDTLRYHMGLDDIPTGLPDAAFNWPPTRELVTYIWRMMAARLHPDVGGSAQTFVAVKQAKEALLDYLPTEAQPSPAPRAKAGKCAACDGHGAILAASGRLGARGLRRRCKACGGTGESCA